MRLESLFDEAGMEMRTRLNIRIGPFSEIMIGNGYPK